MKRFRFSIGILTLIAFLAAGCGGKSLTVTDIWSRPAAAGQTGAVYFLLDNPTSSADTLLGATSDVAQAVESPLSSMDANGVMKMTPRNRSSCQPAGK